MAVKILGHDETQNRVAQKFEPLVMVDEPPSLTRFIGVRAMRERPLEQRTVLKSVVQLILQFLKSILVFSARKGHALRARTKNALEER
jgi:hypothetical protein